MASEIAKLLVALRQWQTAVDNYGHKQTSWSKKEQQLTKAEKRVIDCLKSQEVVTELEALIARAIASRDRSAEDVRAELIKNADPLLTVELRTVHPLGISRKELDKIVAYFLTTPDEDQPVQATEDLQTAFLKVSPAIAKQYRQTAKLSRKPKKQRRRDLALGTLQTAIGMGLLAGNTQMETSLIAHSSYILGGNALMSALNNLVGQLDDAASDRG
ncbi:MAG: hypothetical protein ACFBSG_06985 [Leptolyngbyaceae cyanobacterium]